MNTTTIADCFPHKEVYSIGINVDVCHHILISTLDKYVSGQFRQITPTHHKFWMPDEKVVLQINKDAKTNKWYLLVEKKIESYNPDYLSELIEDHLSATKTDYRFK